MKNIDRYALNKIYNALALILTTLDSGFTIEKNESIVNFDSS